MCELAPMGQDATTLRTKFLEACLPQVASPGGDLCYKNHLIKAVGVVLKTQEREDPALVTAYFDALTGHLRSALEQIKSQSSGETHGLFQSFDERKEEERNNLTTIMNIGQVIPYLIRLHSEEKSEKLALLTEVAIARFSNTNWIVRNSFMTSFKELLTQKTGYEFAHFCLIHAGKCGEKYDANLQLLSDIAVLVTEHKVPGEVEEACREVIKLL